MRLYNFGKRYIGTGDEDIPVMIFRFYPIYIRKSYTDI